MIPRSVTNAYADDLAIAMVNFVAGITALLPLLVVVSRATGLEVNFKKTLVVPSLSGILAAFVASLKHFDAGLPAHFSILFGSSRWLLWPSALAYTLVKVPILRAFRHPGPRSSSGRGQ